MSRTLVAAQSTPGPYPIVTANSRDVTFQAADADNDNYTPIVENKTILLVKNAHATDPKTVSLVSVVDIPFNRTGDVSAYSLSAGEIAIFGPFKAKGWKHLDVGEVGLWIDNEDANIKLAVLQIANV